MGEVRIHSDDRRVAWLEVFTAALPTGNLNVTWVQPGATLAWHRHQQQDDHMLVLQGTLKVGRWQQKGYYERDVDEIQPCVRNLDWTVLSEHHPKELVIERGLWHGYQNIGTTECLLLTWITQPYNPADEERLDPADVNIPWERIPR